MVTLANLDQLKIFRRIDIQTTKIILPQDLAVYQRDEKNLARIPIQIRFGIFVKIKYVTIRAKIINNQANLERNWEKIQGCFNKRVFSGHFDARAGLLDLEFEIQRKKKVSKKTIKNIGIGEVFLVIGQSNVANSGTIKQKVLDCRIRTMNKKGWLVAHDPQPFATNDGGSPWPIFGNMLIEKINMPIGIISAAVGGSSVQEWHAISPNYRNFKKVFNRIGANGVRAIFWHQGESDSLNFMKKEDYSLKLKKLIAQTRNDIGFNVPFIIALAAYHVDAEDKNIKEIISAQKQVINDKNLENVHRGPTTEDLIGVKWRSATDHVHFNENGLKEHGKRWAKRVIKIFFNKKSA